MGSTEAVWIKNYLKQEFSQDAKLVLNGIDKEFFCQEGERYGDILQKMHTEISPCAYATLPFQMRFYSCRDLNSRVVRNYLREWKNVIYKWDGD